MRREAVCVVPSVAVCAGRGFAAEEVGETAVAGEEDASRAASVAPVKDRRAQSALAARGSRNKRSGARGDQPHHLRAGGIVERARAQKLRDLFAKSAVLAKRGFDFCADQAGQALLRGARRFVVACGQGALEDAGDFRTHGPVEIVVSGALEGGVLREARLVIRDLWLLRRAAAL